MITITPDDLALIMAKVTQALDERSAVGREGIVADGSWNPAEGTITVLPGDNFANFDDDDDQPSPIENVPLLTANVGDQGGPLPGDRVVIYHTQSGFAAKLHHGPDDSPGAPAGERWIVVRKRADGTALATLKLTQDGATAGDSAGGLTHSGGSLVKLITAGGLTVTLNDSTKQVIIGLPSGQEIVIDNTAGNVMIGGTGLTQPNNGIVRQADLQTALTNFKAAMVTAGVTNASAIVVPTATSSATSLAK
jgi:hypothetical protein